MLAIYGTHLLGHGGEALEERRFGGKGIGQGMEGVARHLQRLNTAQYNLSVDDAHAIPEDPVFVTRLPPEGTERAKSGESRLC